MRPVRIVTDTCSDMAKDLREKYDIDYMMMNTIRNNEETPASLDWETISAKEFYDILRDGERITTTMVPPAGFQKYFREQLEKGFDIVYIACSSKLSGSVNVGKVEAEAILKDFPDATICCVDSINASMGEGLLAIKAAEFRDQGMSAKEIEEAVLPIRNNINQFVTVETLSFLKAAGRVTGSEEFLGNLLGVRPILISNTEGYNVPLKKVKGRFNSLEELVNQTKDAMAEGETNVYVIHADCDEDDLQDLTELLEEAIPGVNVHIGMMGPIIGASIGAEAIGVWSFGKNVERFPV